MRGRRMKNAIVFLAVTMLIVISAVLFIAYRSGSEDEVRLDLPQSRELDSGWRCFQDGEESSVGDFPFRTNADEASFYYELPEQINPNDVLVFNNRYQEVEVSVDGITIYHYGEDADHTYFTNANVKCYVDLLPEYGGKEIRIYFKAYKENAKILFNQPRISGKGLILADEIKSNLTSMVFCVLTGTAAILFLLIAVLMKVKKTFYGSPIFVSLGLFMLTAAVWVFTDSNLMQLFTDNSQVVMILSFEAFFLMPIPLLWFIDVICSYKKKIIRILEWAFGFNCLIQNLLYICQISKFIRMVVFTHVLMFFCILYLIYYMIKESIYYNSYYAKSILVGICIFISISSLSFITFYRSNGMDNERFFVLGFYLLMLDLIMLSVQKLGEFSESEAKARVFQELAYEDVQTGLGSRTLYEHRLKKKGEDLRPNSRFTVILLDINDLKKINDKYGHSEGDLLIRDAARCIDAAFGDVGECYRIGGDEFVVLVWNMELDPDDSRDSLRSQIEKCNESRNLPLSISSGFAMKRSDDKQEVKITELVKAADQDMYRDKELYRKKRDFGTD